MTLPSPISWDPVHTFILLSRIHLQFVVVHTFMDSGFIREVQYFSVRNKPQPQVFKVY